AGGRAAGRVATAVPLAESRSILNGQHQGGHAEYGNGEDPTCHAAYLMGEKVTGCALGNRGEVSGSTRPDYPDSQLPIVNRLWEISSVDNGIGVDWGVFSHRPDGANGTELRV